MTIKQVGVVCTEVMSLCTVREATMQLPSEKFAVEPDAPIEVKRWFELFGPRFEGQRRLRELRSV